MKAIIFLAKCSLDIFLSIKKIFNPTILTCFFREREFRQVLLEEIGLCSSCNEALNKNGEEIIPCVNLQVMNVFLSRMKPLINFCFVTSGIVDFNFANLYLKNEFISNSFVQTDVIKINRINPLMFFEQISLKLVGAFYHLETFYLEKGKYCP